MSFNKRKICFLKTSKKKDQEERRKGTKTFLLVIKTYKTVVMKTL